MTDSPLPPGGAADPSARETWERLSPLSPILRGGVLLLAALGWLVSQLTNRILSSIGPDVAWERGDNDQLSRAAHYPVVVLGVAAAVLVVTFAFAWLSWRFTRFQITPGQVELRTGWLFRQHRRVPMSRVQAVEISRPLIAQIVGVSKVIVQSAGGSDSHLTLAYLRRARADEVREEIQAIAARADGAQAPTVAGPGQPPAGALPDTALGAPERSAAGIPSTPPATTVLVVPNSRQLAELVFRPATLALLMALAAALIAIVAISDLGMATVAAFSLPALLPAAVGLLVTRASYLLKNGNFSVSTTGDLVRITRGLTDHRTATIPVHRVQAIALSQRYWWRPWGWWRMEVNVAGLRHQDNDDSSETVVVPVASLDEVLRVLAILDPLVSPEGLLTAAHGRGGEPQWVTSPRAAWLFDPLSWRRQGYAVTAHALLIRAGVLLRSVTVVPHARIQALQVRQGPWERLSDLADVVLVSTPGPVRPTVRHLAQREALALYAAQSRRSSQARR